MNTRTHADLMVKAHDETMTHGYWYCRLVGVFHIRVIYLDDDTFGSEPQDIDVLWIRWFGRVIEEPSPVRPRPPPGWKGKRLHRVGFVDEARDKTPAFGFLDPAEVIRGVHLIPVFHLNKSNNGIPETIARPESDDGLDWNYFHVKM